MNVEMSKRTFKLWDYNVSHNQLLIRSPKNEDINSNIDLKFVGVSYLNIPTLFEGCSFVKPIPDEINKIAYILKGKFNLDNIFVISTSEERYIVVAKSCHFSENNLDIFETTLECFGHENLKWQKLKSIFSDEKL
jgi:hypothetical protein